MLKKLRLRFIMTAMSLVGIILLAILISIYFFMAQGEKRQTLDFMYSMTRNEMIGTPKIPSMFDKSPNKNLHEHRFKANPALYTNSFLVTINADGTIALHSFSSDFDITTQSDTILEFIALAKEQNTDEGLIKVNNSQIRFVITRNANQEIMVFTDRSLEIATLNRLLIICLLIGILSLLVLLGISIILSKWAIKPIEKTWEKQKQFVADASHELKTPLTVIATNADVVLANPYDQIKEQSKWLNYIKAETERMTKLVNDLLYLAKLDDDEVLKHKMHFNLSDALIDICLPFECVIFESHKIFNMHIAPDILYYGDEGRIKQLGVILLDNAIKHTHENGTIDFNVFLDTSKNKIHIEVTNTGKGIPLEHQDKIFERFYRVDKSRSRETGSHGLGLAIAKTIVSQHSGTLSVTSNIDGPTTFTAILPIKTKKFL